MAHSKLSESGRPKYVVFPTINKVYCWRVAEQSNPLEPVSRHRKLEFAVLTAASLNKLYAKRTPLLSECDYAEPETTWGACDGQQCSNVAIVYHFGSEMEVCAEHFRTLEGL